jgi:four helix bundle protein
MLRIYSFIIETLRKIAPLVVRIAKHDPDLARQIRRAESSIALNTAEGMGVSGGNERLRFRTALGSTQEVRAGLDVAEVHGYVEVDAQLRDDIDRIAATLYRLTE